MYYTDKSFNPQERACQALSDLGRLSGLVANLLDIKSKT